MSSKYRPNSKIVSQTFVRKQLPECVRTYHHLMLKTDFMPHREEYPCMDKLFSCTVHYFNVYDNANNKTLSRISRKSVEGHITIFINLKPYDPEKCKNTEISPKIVREIVNMAIYHTYCKKRKLRNTTFSLIVIGETGDIIRKHGPMSLRCFHQIKQCSESLSRLVHSESYIERVLPYQLEGQNKEETRTANSINVWRLSRGEEGDDQTAQVQQLLDTLQDMTQPASVSVTFVNIEEGTISTLHTTRSAALPGIAQIENENVIIIGEEGDDEDHAIVVDDDSDNELVIDEDGGAIMID